MTRSLIVGFVLSCLLVGAYLGYNYSSASSASSARIIEMVVGATMGTNVALATIIIYKILSWGFKKLG